MFNSIGMNNIRLRQQTPFLLSEEVMKSLIFTGSKNDRRYFIGGSDARIIMGSDESALLRLWREKRGETEPEDLSGNLIVQLGTVTEDLNRHWYERNTGHAIKDIQRRVKHPVIKWMAATLDGVVEPTGAVFEAKFICHGRSRRKGRPRITCRSFSTTCG
jgi:predicted phage-related endonuclease